jgi:flagellar M-ring protein FliF
MPDDRLSFVNQLREMWARLLWPQRLTIIGFALLGLVCIGVLVYFMSRVEYEPLYGDLNPEAAHAIGVKLNEKKIKYILEGTSILVAASPTEIAKLKLEIAGSDLAGNGKVGFEIFDKNQFGMTDFTDHVNLQRALEGELARTISVLSEVSDARVHIVLPKDSVFEENKEDAKASVVLKMKKGQELSKSNITAIKNLCVGAVPGLHTYNVSIVDDEARLLSQSVDSGNAARSEMESGLREQIEKEMSGKVISILETAVGKGNVQANASIDLDFNTTEETEETFNPNPQAIMSQQKSEERAGNSSTPAGIPGTQSNLTPQASVTGTSTPEHYRQSEATNYEVNKLVRHTIQPKGTVIRRLCIAVTVDHKPVITKLKDGKSITSSEPRSQEELNSYRELVLAAVGYNEERGDVVTIKNIPFYSETKLEEPQAAVPIYIKYRAYFLPGMKYIAIIVIFIIGYIIFVRPIRKRVFRTLSLAAAGAGESSEVQLPAEASPMELPGGKRPEELSAAEGAGAAAALPSSEANPQDEILSLDASDEQIERELMKEASMVDLGSRKYAAIKKKIIDKAIKDPEMISQLVRSLLREKV